MKPPRRRRSRTSSPAGRLDPGADAAALLEFLRPKGNRQPPRGPRGAKTPCSARIRGYELAARMQASVPLVTNLDGEGPETLATLRGRPPRDRRLRPRLPDRPAADGAGRPVRPAPLGRDLQQPPAELGRARGHEGQPRPGGPADRQAGRRPAAGPPPQGACSTTRSCCSPPSSAGPRSRSRPPRSSASGRDHNPFGFSVWLAGAGLKHGIAHGSTDEIGWKAVEHPVTWPDFHAIVLHLLGIDHQKLTYYHNGIRRRLTNVHGEVVRPILA